MTLTRWEYAIVKWTNDGRKITRNDPEWQRLPQETREEYDRNEWAYCWWADWTFWVCLPGRAKTPEKRAHWSTLDTEAATSSLDILNELGADGWEVVSTRIDASAMGTNHGRENAAYPIESTVLLKRPVVE